MLPQFYFWAKGSVIKRQKNKESKEKREQPRYQFTAFPSLFFSFLVLRQLLTTPFIEFWDQTNSSEFNEEDGRVCVCICACAI